MILMMVGMMHYVHCGGTSSGGRGDGGGSDR